jgi:hypothetical protein
MFRCLPQRRVRPSLVQSLVILDECHQWSPSHSTCVLVELLTRCAVLAAIPVLQRNKAAAVCAAMCADCGWFVVLVWELAYCSKASVEVRLCKSVV